MGALLDVTWTTKSASATGDLLPLARRLDVEAVGLSDVRQPADVDVERELPSNGVVRRGHTGGAVVGDSKLRVGLEGRFRVQARRAAEIFALAEEVVRSGARHRARLRLAVRVRVRLGLGPLDPLVTPTGEGDSVELERPGRLQLQRASERFA